MRALITGVSRGLGAALFDQLHQRGDRVIAIGRRFTDRQAELAAAEPERVVLHRSDLARPASLPDASTWTAWLAGCTDVALIHNAAVVEPIGTIGALPPDRLAAAVAVNLTAPMLLTNAFLAALPPAATATILFVSSGAAHRVIDGWAAYGATKRGGEAFFEALATQVANQPRITVTSLNPGVMDTGMQVAIRSAVFTDRERFRQLHERGELPDPADVAREIIRTHLLIGSDPV